MVVCNLGLSTLPVLVLLYYIRAWRRVCRAHAVLKKDHWILSWTLDKFNITGPGRGTGRAEVEVELQEDYYY